MVKATRKCIGPHPTGDFSQDLSLFQIVVLGFHLPHQEQELALSQKAFWSTGRQLATSALYAVQDKPHPEPGKDLSF